MAFAKGQTGNPGGRPKDKPWTDAIRLAANEMSKTHKGTRQLRAMANKLVAEAIDGNIQAIKEVGDRLEGKAMQPVEADVTGGLTIEVVKFADTDPK